MIQSLLSQLNAWIAPLAARVKLMVATAVVKLVDDSKAIQELQLSAGDEPFSNVPNLQQYGFSSNPKPGAVGLLVFMGGDRSRGFAAAVGDPETRPKNLEPGEVVIYTDEGDTIRLKRNRRVEVNTRELVATCEETAQITAGTQITLTAPLVRVEGELEVTGDVTADADGTPKSLIDFIDVYDIHTHNENNDFHQPSQIPNELYP